MASKKQTSKQDISKTPDKTKLSKLTIDTPVTPDPNPPFDKSKYIKPSQLTLIPTDIAIPITPLPQLSNPTTITSPDTINPSTTITSPGTTSPTAIITSPHSAPTHARPEPWEMILQTQQTIANILQVLHKPHQVKIKTFNGQDNVTAWVEQFLRIVEANNWEQKFAKAQLESSLVHTAKIWFRNYCKELDDTGSSLEDVELQTILNQLSNYFYKPDNYVYIYEQLDNFRQKPEESILEYYTRFMEFEIFD